jgi:hypothetical protein
MSVCEIIEINVLGGFVDTVWIKYPDIKVFALTI